MDKEVSGVHKVVFVVVVADCISISWRGVAAVRDKIFIPTVVVAVIVALFLLLLLFLLFDGSTADDDDVGNNKFVAGSGSSRFWKMAAVPSNNCCPIVEIECNVEKEGSSS